MAPRDGGHYLLAHVQLLRLSDLTVLRSSSEPYLRCMSIRRGPGSRAHPPTFAESSTPPEFSDPGPRKQRRGPIAHVAREQAESLESRLFAWEFRPAIIARDH
jgi:hypothetical protein